jgi:polysaccharide biosynthesis transport protein
MLDTDQSRPIAGAAASPSIESPEQIYASFVAFVRRQFPIILFVTLLSLGLAVVYCFTTPPFYTAEAVLLIDSHKLDLFQQQAPLGVDLPLDTAMVDSQVEILNSESIALSVIKDLHLADDPEFIGPSGGLFSAVYDFVSEAAASLFGSVEPNSEFALTRKALERFQNRLSVKRVGLTYVIDIDFESRSPDRAAQIANAMADAYVVDALEAKYQSTKRAAIWLQDRLTELRAQATSADRKVVDFKAKNNIVDTGGRLLNEQELAELNSALVLARAETAEAQAKMDRVQQLLNAKNDNPVFDQKATVTDSLHDDVITRLRQQYLDLSAREEDWSARYGPTHLAVINLQNQMQEIRSSIGDELRRIAETYKSDYEIAKSREESLQKSLDSIVSQSNETNQAQITMRDLDSTAQSYRAIADNFLQQYMMSVQQQSFPITESRLITQATAPLKKSHPKTPLVLAIALAGGVIVSFGVGTLRDFSDKVFRTGTQLENSLALDCISVIPKVKAAKSMVAVATPADGASFDPRTIVRDQSLLWHTLDAPFSRFSESIRTIKVAVDLYAMSKVNKVIGFTSSLPNEGKTTIATALAQFISDAGSRVILVDADLRNPALSRRIAPSAAGGIIEVICGQTALQDVIWMDPATKLCFLPAVAKSRLLHTSEMLGSDAARNLFDKLREAYDYVIVDLSPLAPVVDVRATTNLIDSYVFVVEWGRTKIDVVRHALTNAREIKSSILGVALNKADINVISRYESYRGNYYHNRYYSRYGYTE